VAWDEDRIASVRLDLVPLAPGLIEAMLGGRRAEAEAALGATLPPVWPERENLAAFRLFLDRMRRDPSARRWLVRAMVLRGERPAVVGHIGFHLPPDPDGSVEIGFTVDEAHRRRGYAREAAGALIGWAFTQEGVDRIRASIAPGNEPSLALARMLGFEAVGTAWDETDAREEIVFELPRPKRPAAR
jgi:RimJ/RimL family protein N-acetyltransferase